MIGLLLSSSASCTTKFTGKSERLPDQAKIAVLMVSRDGSDVHYTMKQTYVYHSMIQADLQPMSLNEIDVGELYTIDGNESEGSLLSAVNGQGSQSISVESGNVLPAEPMAMPKLLRYVENQDIDYLLLLYTRVHAMDETLKAVLIRVSDRHVIGSKYYNYSFMKPFCIPMTLVFGLSVLICPWFFLREGAGVKHEMIDETLKDFMH